MIHIQPSTATKRTFTKQIMPLSRQAVFGCAGMLARTGLSGRNLLGRSSAFVGLWSDCEHGLFAGGLSVTSSTYINRLESTRYRSGKRRRLAAIPS